MKAFSDGHAPVARRLRECQGDVVGVHMMHGFEPEVRQGDFFTSCQELEHHWVKMAGWIQRFPSGSDDMPRMQDRCRKSRQTSLPQEIFFNRGFPNAIIAKRFSWR